MNWQKPAEYLNVELDIVPMSTEDELFSALTATKLILYYKFIISKAEN